MNIVKTSNEGFVDPVLQEKLDTDANLRVQVPNNHILTQNQYYNYYYPKRKYLIIGYMDPLVHDTQIGRKTTKAAE